MSNQAHKSEARISVALDVPLRQVFDYWLPADETAPESGCRVRVPFGNRILTGLVWSTPTDSLVDPARLKTASEIIDQQPLIDTASRELIDFAARYYHHPIGEVAAAALPPALRHGASTEQVVEYLSLSADGIHAITATLEKRAPRQHQVLSALAEHGNKLAAGALQSILPGWRRVAAALIDRGWLNQTFEAQNDDWQLPAEPEAGPTLNQEQRTATEAIANSFGQFQGWLLDGVTGSGKTEIFLQLIQRMIAADRQTLIVVPEIGLTPQLVSRLERRLGVRVALLHSNLPDAERSAAWLAACKGKASVVLGTRSAIFTPLARPGLIIVDEEHDASLKQQEGFRYHARDLAVWRANRASVPVVLSSATPSLESLWNANQGRYKHLRLTERAGGAAAPIIKVIDSNRFNLIDGISQPVIDTMREHLERDNQVLVYLNRRGYAPTLICSDCGTIADCQHCDAHMTVHAGRQQLQCHHCGARRSLPNACDACGQPVKPLGEGTERVAEALLALLPEYSLARIDSDTTAARGGLQKALDAARSGKTKILIGTQMLAKGHHLPKLSLVVVLNADQGFFASDFRASERLAQTIVQVAGRAGRADTPGEVLIQSAYPRHHWLHTLVSVGYGEFASQVLAERQQAGWPPYEHIAVLHAAASQETTAINFLHRAKHELTTRGVETLGPAPASMLRRAGRYRYQLLLTSPSRQGLQHQLQHLVAFLQTEKSQHRLRWSLDVDPHSEL